MSKRIIGVTVGTPLPKPNFKQTDPTKGDYIKNKPDFDGLKDHVDIISTLIGNNSVSDQISEAISNIDFPVESVNGQTGDVYLTAEDVGALPNTTEIPSIDGLATEVYVDNAISNINVPDEVYVQNDEPLGAPDGSLWVDLDADIKEEPEIVIDYSLTQLGQAADAKAVGDALAKRQPIGNYATVTDVEKAIAAIPTPDVSGQINKHNIAAGTHNDIRLLIEGLTNR